MNNLYIILAQAADAAQPATQQQGNSTFLIMMVCFLAAMYFLMIAPQRKRQKQHEQMLQELESGDEVITIGGIYGKITNKTDKTFTLKISETTKIEILKSAVSQKVEAKAENSSEQK